MPDRPAPGRAVVTRRAVTDIVRAAVLGSYGVAGFATPNPLGHVVRALGLGEPGIRVSLDDLRVELRIRVAYGLPIAEVARQVESAVRYALKRDLGRDSSEVAIHIDGLDQREGSVPSSEVSPTGDEGTAAAPTPGADGPAGATVGDAGAASGDLVEPAPAGPAATGSGDGR